MIHDNTIHSLALVIPVYNETEGLLFLFDALNDFQIQLKDVALRVVFVDDHSDDRTPDILRQECEKNPWFSYIRLSRRVGSHMAIIAGLGQCSEDAAAFLASDLQDPLDMVPQMVDLCRRGHDVVWGVRDGRDGQSWFEHVSSNLFYKAMRKLSDIGDLPFQASYALLSYRAYKNLVKNAGPRASLIVEIPYLGFPVAKLPFKKASRRFGKSKWTLKRKLVALFDAVVSSSYMPLRFMMYSGAIISLLGFAYAFVLVNLWLFGVVHVQGRTSMMLAILIVGGLQMLMLGIIGEYLWRSNENTHKRALFLIEESFNIDERNQ